MPLVSNAEYEERYRTDTTLPRSTGDATLERPKIPGYLDTFASAARESNWVVNYFQRQYETNYPPEDGFDVFDYIKNSPYEANPGPFLGVRSRKEADAVAAGIKRERQDKENLANGGTFGTLAAITTGLATPENLIIPGGVIKASRSGFSAWRSGLSWAGHGAVAAGLTEAGMKLTQYEPGDMTESAINIGSGTLINAMLGGSIARLMTVAERARAVRYMDAVRKQAEAHANPEGGLREQDAPASPAQAGAAGDRAAATQPYKGPDVESTLEGKVKATGGVEPDVGTTGKVGSDPTVSSAAWKPGEAPEREGIPPGLKIPAPLTESHAEQVRAQMDGSRADDLPPGAVGVTAEQAAANPLSAAATDTRSALNAPLVLPLTDAFAPTRRNLTETAPVEARRLWSDLVENPTETKDAHAGVAATQGPAASRLVHLMLTAPLMRLAMDVDELFARHRQMQPGRWRKMFTQVKDWIGDPPPGTLTLEQFKEEASRVAAVVGARSSYPEAQELAERIREGIFDPFAELAKIHIPGFKLTEGEPYFPHMWDKNVIRAKPIKFRDKLIDKYADDQAQERVIQENLKVESDNLKTALKRIENLDTRIEKVGGRISEREARLREREMETARTGERVALHEERLAGLREDLNDVQNLLDELGPSYNDPLLRDYVNNLQRRVNQLRQRDVPMTEAQMAGLEEEELRTILTGTRRKAAEMLVGRRKLPKPPETFIQWIVSEGGLADVGGTARSIVDKVPPGFINQRLDPRTGKMQGLEVDELAQRMRETFPSLRADEGIDENRINEWLSESTHGREPDFMFDNMPAAKQDDLAAAKLASVIDETMTRAGMEPPKKIADVARIFRDARVEAGSITLEDLDRVAAEMESAGQSIPIRFRAMEAEDKLAGRREDFAQMRQMIADARAYRDARLRRISKEEAVATEAGLGMEANLGRLGVLEEQLSLAETKRGLLTWAREVAQRDHDLIRERIEEQVGQWQGTSASEAKSQIKAREKYEAEQALKQVGYGPQQPEAREGARLTRADSAVDSFVKQVLADNLDLSRDELGQIADQTINRILGSPDGRLPYDFNDGGPKAGWNPDKGPPPRGPMHGRRLNVNNEWAWDWINKDIEDVARAYATTMAKDLGLVIKMQDDVDLTNTFRKIDDGFSRLRLELDKRTDLTDAEKETAQTALEKRRQNFISDTAAARDMIRGVYGWSADGAMQKFGEYATYAKQIANIVSINGAMLSAVADFAGPIIRHGMGAVYGEGFPLLIRMLTAKGDTDPFAKMLYEELRAMGIGTDVVLNRNRGMENWADVYQSQSRFARTLQTVNDLGFAINGLNHITDAQKVLSGAVAHVSYIRAMRKWVAGGNEALDPKMIARLADGGVNIQTAARILKQIDDDPATLREGAGDRLIEVSNPANWKDREAMLAFSGLIARDADIAVPTPGHEIPVMASAPVTGVLFQFKRVIFAGNERILAANLQRPDAMALAGVFHYILFGMLSYRIAMATQGKDVSDKPMAEWVREGIDRANVSGLLSEANNMMKKLTGADVFRPFGATEESSRFQSRNKLETILGPTAGRVNNVLQFTYNLGSGNYAASDTRALRNAVWPWQNLWYTRWAVNRLEEGLNHTLGVPETRPQ